MLITLGITGVTSYYKSGFFSPCRQTFLLRQIYKHPREGQLRFIGILACSPTSGGRLRSPPASRVRRGGPGYGRLCWTYSCVRKKRLAIWSAMPATANMVARATIQNPMRPRTGASKEPTS